MSQIPNKILMDENLEEQIQKLQAQIERSDATLGNQFSYLSTLKSLTPMNESLGLLNRESMTSGKEEPSVLLMGELGTEKFGIARAIHLGSRRSKGPWITLNCGEYSGETLQKELFGFEDRDSLDSKLSKAGVLELATGGTLFLDVIEKIEASLQFQLLRAVKAKVFRKMGSEKEIKFDVRIICGVTTELKDNFQEEFYQRFSQSVILIPPLRQRGSDILLIAARFAEHSLHQFGKYFHGFTPDSEKLLMNYSWPGNIDELRSVMQRAALNFKEPGMIPPQFLAISHSDQLNNESPHLEVLPGAALGRLSENPLSYTELKKKWSDSFEVDYLASLLNRHQGNVSAAAREAKLDRSNFLRLLRRHRIKGESFRKVA